MPKNGPTFQPTLCFRGERGLRFFVQKAKYDYAHKHMNCVNGREHEEKHKKIIGHRGQPVGDLGIPFKDFVYEKYYTGQNRQPEPNAISRMAG